MVRNPFEIAPADDDDDHDEHWDGDFHDEEHDDNEQDNEDDEAAFDGRPTRAPPRSLNGHAAGGRGHMNGGLNGHHTTRNKKKKMQKMKVATQRDYNGPTVNIHMFNMFLWEPRTRGVCCLGSISFAIILLFIGWIVPKEESSAHHGSTTTQAPEAQCQVHTTHEAFSEWMHTIKVTNSTELCRPEVPTTDCNCHNPFESTYDDTEGWLQVFESNLQALNESGVTEAHLDLVLYGDSIVERMNGRVFGNPLDELQDQLATTEQLFTKEGGGKINALPLGIAGEEIHTLMYRLKNGEMPATLKPGVWWLMIGTNDVVKGDCDVDAVVAGIVTVAQEIMRRDEINRQSHASTVVINSLFPRVTLDADPLWKNIQDINQRLECYATTTHGVEFFNATTLFVHDNTGEIDTNAFAPDGIHLTAHGMRIWEEAIVLKTLSLIDH